MFAGLEEDEDEVSNPAREGGLHCGDEAKMIAVTAECEQLPEEDTLIYQGARTAAGLGASAAGITCTAGCSRARMAGREARYPEAASAAALSLVSVVVSVILSYRLTSRGHLEQWRREQVRPVIARILTLSSNALREWAADGRHEVAVVRDQERPGQARRGRRSHGRGS
jgi:hypothetical protein